MADHLTRLCQFLAEEKLSPSSSSLDLLRKLRSDKSIKLGLQQLYLILQAGLDTIEPGSHPRFKSYSDNQILSLASLGSCVTSVFRSLSVEQLEPIIVAVARKFVEFTISFLEKSEFSGDDLSLQSNMIQLLEIILGGGTDKIVDFLQPASVNSLVDLLPTVSSNLDGIELDDNIKCGLQGIKCSRAEKQVDRLLLALASEFVQPERHASGFEAPTFHQDLNSLIFLSQHWAVAHAECIRCLILLCKELVELPDTFDERIAGTNFCKRLSFSLRILKSLGCLVKEVPYVEYDSSMLEAVASCADVLPNLFRPSFEFVNNIAATEGNFESLVLSLVEEFIHLVRVIFCNNVVFLNVQACMVASILEHLGPSVWRYNKAASNIKAPLAYFPRTVIYTLKLIQDLRIQLNEVVDLKEISTELGGCVDLSSDSPSCQLRVQKIPLLKRFTFDELSRMIFPSSGKWMDNLMHLVSFLHSEGVKLRQKMERSTSSGRSNCSSELENAVCHDDEALFGNLFSEGNRTLGSADVCDQTSTVSSSSSNCNMPMQAATELLNFLKGCIFSHEWLPSIYEDGCRRLSADHIDILLHILSCHGCHFEDNFASSHEDRKSGNIPELSFQLLHNLLTQHALSDLLEDYLVERILNVENGTFVYNDQTLTLLAHALFSKVGLAGSQLRTNIYRGFVSFIVEKAKSICSDCPNLKELLVTLPSVFHIEILLMAFHLSPDEDKATMANFIFSALRTIDVPSAGSYGMQLSCWALVVSRLILVLRHMILHPRTCPPSLLLAFRSKLRDTQCFVSHVPTNSFDDFSSLASIAAKDLTGALVDEEPSSSSLFHQLIDVAYLQSPLFIDDVAIGSLHLSWGDLCSSFSYLLGLWNGKKAAAIEDLIIERYIFLLCWDMPCMKSLLNNHISLWSNMSTEEISSIEQLFCFSHSLLGQCNAIGNGADFQNLVVGLLRCLHGANLHDNFENLGWDFLRKGMWMSLILSFFNVGIGRYCVKNNIPRGGPFWTENRPSDNEYSNSAEGFISCLIEGSQISELLRMFASFLKGYLQAYEKAFLATLGDSQHDDFMFSPVLLLKLSTFDKFLWDELLKKCGVDSFQLESVLDILLKVDGAVEKRASGILAKVFWECMLHGFPSHHRTSSGILLSCILNIRGIVFTLDGLLKLAKLKGNIFLEIDVQHQILDSLTSVKLDRIFENLHGKCEDVCLNLNSGLELSDYTELFLLKRMEGFLRYIHSREQGDTSILEWVITKTIDTMDALRKDPKKSTAFKFYLGAEDLSEPLKELHGSQRGDILVLIDSVANCYSESVNIKVLSFLVDLLSGELCPNLKLKIHTKYLSMDLLLLSKWLEKRLLGYTVEAMDGVKSVKAISVSLRESTMSFILCLVSSHSELQSELYNHLFEAVLILLETAFLQFDIHTAKSYFHFVVQLAREENSMKLLLKRTIMLMQKLAGDERLLPGLKFIFGFLGCFLSDCGSSSNTTEKCSGKSPSVSSVAVGTMASRPVGSRKNSDVLVLSGNRDGASAALECDATSVDEDEDDGTSDGEEASIDKDEEEDTNSERALASKVCTFTSSGSNFMEQHWYFCYTCDLTVSKGCCSVCAKVCHRGHRVVYSRSSRFFCDCGAGGVRGSNCQCLKPRKFTGSDNALNCSANNFQSFLPLAEDADQLPESDSDVDEDVGTDMENSLRLSIPKDLQDGISMLLEELDVESQVLELCSSLLPSITSRRESNLSKDKKIILGKDKVLSYGMDLLQLKKAYKSGSLDLKIKTDYSNGKELKMHLASGSLVKSLLSVSIRGRLAVGEGDKVTIFDVGQLIGQATIAPVTADKANLKALSKNLVRFEIVHLAFNNVVENYLAVAGYEDCQVLTLNPRGEVTDRLAIELALQGAYIRRIEWVPGSQVQLMVVTNRFVKIYDLSQDNISPMHYFTLPDDTIVDATLSVASQGRMFLIVLSERGSLFRLGLSLEGRVGATPLKEIIHIQDREIHAKGSSLYFSCTYKLLFLSYQDGTTLIGQLSPDATSLTEISCVYEEEQDGKLRPAGLHRWKELLIGSGLFCGFSSVKANSAIAVSFSGNELFAQNLRHAMSSSSPLVGITAYKPLSNEKVHCLVLHDDGSLQIYSHVPMGVDAAASATAEKVKKLGSNILNNKAYAGTKPEFPLDFFEKTVCITADVKLGGDAIRNGDSEGAKQSLASEDGFLESPSPAGFKISVSNSNPDIVMVGFRVYVGNQSANHIPSEITIFQRVIKLDEGMRSWYDIPFTVAESLLADEEFIISVGPTFSGTALPRIDSLEVYGRAKDEFGWKEKMDAVLDLEARVIGANSVLAGSGKKSRSMQSAPIQEQVVADGLKLLSRIYSFCRPQEGELKVDLSKLKSKQLLEAIFESDREPLMLAAACRVLQAVFPKKDIYYQIKDTMRLLGVVKSTSVLSSRLGIGGATGRWLIEEFTAQMRAVSKIALHRRSNLSSFLEMNGSEVVDGLMQVLWGILDLELPDTQTMNNIVISAVELIYSFAECLALHGKDTGRRSVAPAVILFKKLLFFPNEAVQTSSSLAISSRLLQVPFPKQTMLGTDDVGESAVTTSVPADTSGGNSQVMIEEDSITSSVQYCCDGCSTVPILRRRWHCTVCPDFDLCEACYEVLDADRLPLPHSRDHPMTAIPIEVESLGGDGSEIRFSTDDLGESNLVTNVTDVGLQTSAPSIHVLEPSESMEFSSSMTDPVSISASKRAVNSLLLSELLEQLKGWMETTSGIRAIPVMQLFYRLSSAVGGPFIDSSKSETLDLEKLITWFLDEINLNKPFIARTRSSFGEVAILVFMFFTLMLRNWHQPGSDGAASKGTGNANTPDKSVPQVSSSVASQSSLVDHDKNDFASQLLRACNSLRNQAFVNYLMDVLQQLVHVFKSPAAGLENAHGSNVASGCGALLTIRRDLPAGNFSPFFSDSYAKAHRADAFMDYHRLLLENAFRLVYTLVRPEKHDKNGEKEKVYKASSGKDLKLDGHQEVLCSYINNPHTTFVRRYARRLFLHLCGSKTHYYSVRDSWQFSTEVKKLYKHVNKSGGFQNPVPYERSVKIVKCLSTIAEVAAARPRNWQKYCLRHSDVLPFLMNGIFYFGEESVIQTLKLLNLAFYLGKDMNHSLQKVESGDLGTSSNKTGTQFVDSKKKKKGDDGVETGLEKSFVDMEMMVEIFTVKGADVLRQFIDCFLLEWNSSSVRVEAKGVLYGVWHHGKHSFKETVLAALLQKVKCLPMYGQNIVEYTELVTRLLSEFPDKSLKQQTEIVDRCLTPDVIRSISETLHSQNELIANHPNSRIYNTLSGLVEFDGYYLESEPCVACSSPEVPYSRMKLESLKSETKFTDNRIIVKCTGSYTIQTVTMNVHDARKSKSVKVLNLYYNNRPVADLSELKNNWSLWKRARSCHLAFNQSELKVEFTIPITACNFMIELDSFYENLQALSLEPLQCPRCSRPVTDKHGICSNCHENAYQCRQCRNINYENLDSFLCNECGYSKYGRFEFNFMAKPSFTFDNMENDEDMKKGLAAIEAESENAHRRYQQLLGFKKPLLKIVSSIGENEMDSQQKDSVQQMMVSLPGPSCKINRKIALLGVLYGEKCKAAFDSVSKSVQTLQGLRRVLMNYLHQKHSDNSGAASRFVISRTPNNCYGCAMTFVTQCLEILQVLSKHQNSKKQLVASGILSELFENNIHQGPKTARVQARAALCAFSEGDINAVSELNSLIQKKVMYCLEHHRSMDIAVASREELLLLSEVCSLADEFWESRLRIVFHLLFSSIKLGAKHPAISEHIILPCLRIISLACTPPKPDTAEKEQGVGKSTPVIQQKDENNSTIFGSHGGGISSNKLMPEPTEKNWVASHKTQDIQLLSYSEWEKGASYLDFVRRQYKVSQSVKGVGLRSRPHRTDFLALKYGLRWKRSACKANKGDLSVFELGSWVTELVLSACSQSIRSEMCMLISLLCAQSSSRRFRLLNLLMGLLPATLAAGESAAEYFELLFKMIESEDARLFLTVRGCLDTICKLITKEVGNIESLERSLHIDISQGFILHKLIELLGKFLEVPNIRSRFMRDNLLTEVLEALIVIHGLIVQKTKLISDCNRLLKDLLDSLLLESSENKRQFIRACICGLQIHGEEKKGRTCLFILEQLCNLICPSKPEAVYLLVLNKAHTQEEYIRGSMTKNPYSSAEIGPLMRDVKDKICHQLDLIGLLEDDYSMELLVAGNIISLDLSIAQVYEHVWKKSNSQSSNSMSNSQLLSSGAVTSSRECSPMIVTYRLQGLDGEATEPMIKELEEDREESQDPEVEFAIAGAVREYDGLEILLPMIQRLRDDFKSNQEQLVAVLNLLMHCCKIRENRRALLRLGALGLLLETARRAFSVDALEPAEGILLIVESLTMEANESDNISISQSVLTVTSEETGTGDQAKKIVLMFLERLSHPSGHKKSNKQQRNTEMVARILPYLTYGEPDAMEALIQHFNPYLQDWGEFDRLQKQHQDNPKDETIALQAAKQRFTVENFVMVSESLKTSSCGERLKDIILEKGITGVAVRHLSGSFAIAGQAGFKASSEWALALKLPSVPLVLSMLRGLSMGHFATQRCIDEGGILPLLHALEGVPGENEIGAKAENLLDTLSDKEGKGDGFLEEKVRKLRHATRDEMRRRALRKREELLQGLGMRQELASDGGERIVVAQPLLEGLEDVEEEEDGLACMVCREGYSLRPTDLLGVYCYSKRVNLGVGTSGSARGECVYTTVSYFNIIHFQCHQEAKRADAALKIPKKEWEGATLRNNESLCNSLFPVRGPSVPLAQYVRYVDQYWDNLNALGRADGSRLRLLTYDIVLMLARYATGASFSAESRGGGRESNSRFLPFMIQMARHLLEQGGPSQRRSMTKAVATYLSSSTLDSKSTTSGTQASLGTEETVQFMMVNSLLSESYESWLQHRRDFLQRGIYHAYMQHTHGRPTTKIESASSSKSSTSTSESSGEELLSIVRPMLVYTGLIEQLQQIFKVKKSSITTVKGKAEGTSTGTEGEGLEAWEVVMKERLLNVKEMLGFSKELLSWLDDMNSATDLQEAFDIIGALGDVLSGGFTQCEDFVQAAIAAGKM
ncbi:BIG, LOW PHOSPHATE-RESISTANT ROOT 1, DARK OVER-EXPRESSION OF CAB 1, TRANSPORT INHIBITOR RESPONSE 3 [Hibiscus trionum]|uniref:Auxin transport protein BIG n=1 Tax=Hibiscus trionum TaxID=183268 RepID=A0A9W7H0R9_HIBTR|nr:BIG, LOW PHOSPHATE-RESISTANT ROOT 1, DARK OVER-EXPRESSION OF CAB 1, TRANSPORT INHIBITOR RESPONSE 3 [Hibiscus trionum]